MNDALIQSILTPDEDPRRWAAQVASATQTISQWSHSDIEDFLTQLVPHCQDKSPDEAALLGTALLPVVQHLVRRDRELTAEDPQTAIWSTHRLQGVIEWYRQTPADHELRNHLLHWLATANDPEVLGTWADLICDDPPGHRPGIAWAFAPLLNQDANRESHWVANLLEQLLEKATGFPQIASAVFDLANHFHRHGWLDQHPASERVEALTELLGQLAGQLGKIEDGDVPAGADPQQINCMVSDSVAMIVALCDTFSLLEHQPAIGKLHQVLSLRHRRVQTEAAAALAKLDDPLGKQALIGLAEEPIARLRVLAYAEELGLSSEISLEYQGEIAIAESHLATWLAEPQQMGLAPAELELLDSRELSWPSYEHPVLCYLFRFEYGSGDRAFRNVGICGPVTHAFDANIQHLSIDDSYALFAGWQTLHQEIFQMSAEQAERNFGNDYRRLNSILRGEDADEADVQIIGSFFGELILVAAAVQDGKSGTFVVDSNNATWIETGNPEAPIDAPLAYTLWRGRQLLATFNESETSG